MRDDDFQLQRRSLLTDAGRVLQGCRTPSCALVHPADIVLPCRHPGDRAAPLLVGEAENARVAERIARHVKDGGVGALLATNWALCRICRQADCPQPKQASATTTATIVL